MGRVLDVVKRVLFWVAMFAAVAGSAALAVLLFFLGHMVDPIFYLLFTALVGGLAGIGVWLVREVLRDRAAARADADTEVFDVEAIAEHLPPPSPHRPVARWLRQACGRAQRIKEGAP